MSAQDAVMFHLEDDNNPMHIGNVVVFEGPAPAFGDLVERIATKLPLVPRYRQRVRELPLELGRPVWVDDPGFTILHHVRRTTLPPPGGPDRLRRFAAGVFSRRLDRRHSLWEIWMVDGLADGRWALVCKTHHAMVDGIAGTDLLTLIFDREREPRIESSAPWAPARAPALTRLLWDAAADYAALPLRHGGELRHAVATPGETAGDVASFAAGAASWALRLFQPSALHLNGPIGGGRRWGWTGMSLDAMEPVCAAFDATVNDVVMAAITRGFRDLLVARGDRVDRPVRSLMPVSMRSARDDRVNNRVSAYFVDMPVGEPDPVARLRFLQRETAALKHTSQARAADVLMQMTGLVPAPVQFLGARVATLWPQASVNTVTTNVPGPRYPLYLCGRRMLEGYPYVPLWGTIRASVAVFSYCGRVDFGVTGDRASMPDLDVLIEGIGAGLDELVLAARAQQRRRPAVRGRRRPAVAKVS